MACGISTANFFPENTLNALRDLVGAKVPVTEIFLNTYSEMEDDYVNRLLDVIEASGIRVTSVHPFSSPLEGFYFATNYESRLSDGIKFYRRFFEICQVFGADKLVFHGDHAYNEEYFPMDEYVANFSALARVGREYGVTLCHENVSYCRLGDPAAVRAFRMLLGDEAAFVLDTKQVKRKGADMRDMLDAMGGAVRHVHISDYNQKSNCLPPGQGDMDYPGFIARLKQMGYAGDFIIELYRDNFEDLDELVRAMQYIDALQAE